MTDTDEAAFIAAILATPDDDTPRLVFADWLDERARGDDAARAALIRAQCRLEHLAPNDRGRTAVAKEVKALLKAHAKPWTAPLRAAGLGEDWTFRRGFIDSCSISPTLFVKHAEFIFRHAPLLREIRFPHAQSEVSQLAASPFLARLGSVALAQMCTCGRCPIDVELRDLFKSKHTGGLSRLNLALDRIDADMARALVESESLSRLTSLGLYGNPLKADGMRVLAGARHFTRLAELDLGGSEFDVDSAEALAEGHFPALTKLDLSYTALRPGALRVLMRAPFFPQLTTLDLPGNRIGVTGAAALAKLPATAKLTSLDVRHNNLNEKSIRELKARFKKGVQV